MKKVNKLQESYIKLSLRYKMRHFDSHTKAMAIRFMIDCYKQYRGDENTDVINKTSLQHLWLGAELLDYFNELNPLLGVGSRDKFSEREIYDWLIKIAQDLLNNTQQFIQDLSKLKSEKDIDFLHHKIRFSTAVALNEKYRKGEYKFV